MLMTDQFEMALVEGHAVFARREMGVDVLGRVRRWGGRLGWGGTQHVELA
jgi:hypothetical protein